MFAPSKLMAVDQPPEGYVQPAPIVKTKDELIQTVYQLAKANGVNPQVMVNTINCENTDWNSDLQSRITTKNGTREESYGLAQINLPSHPNISYAQATDPEFAINYMATQMAEGKASQWSCYRQIYK